ncbi:MAG: bifunctional DNA primase/polymerase [Chthonomonadaceae bacterium]|nr:bifunctional DNA primase/polymerase [Chthonomonadaceae bacterium]
MLLAAEAYSALGYAVIPLLGDRSPDRPKAPALPWNDYRKHKPRPDELRRWFMEEDFQGIGLVTGRISGLVVLDFDNADLFNEFRVQYPELAEQQVIQTRRGFHIYFQLPGHLSLASRTGQGVDLLSEGRYVVARPTTIAGFTYRLIRGGQPRRLTPRDIARIQHFLDQRRNRYADPVSQPAVVRQPAPVPLSPADLQALYQYHLRQGRGRNEALFLTALTARDHDCSKEYTIHALADLHTNTPAVNSAHQSERQRHNEALHTVASAFSRPARPPRYTPKPLPTQLPARAREALYALKLTCVIRVIEGLREKGIPPGQSFTRNTAINLLSGLVGRFSIDKALHARTPSGKPFFEAVSPPSTPHRCAASSHIHPDHQKCFIGRVSKPGKSYFVYQPRHYQMPTNTTLCHLLGTPHSLCDPLGMDDLSSAKKTRLAAHRAFLQRRPGQYPRRWLAARLGISACTTRRYDRALGVHVKTMFHEQTVTWATLNRVPDFRLDGTFLQDENGKRYPALRDLAARLLNSGHSLTYCRQDANFYSLDPPQVVTLQVIAREQVWRNRQRQIEARIALEQGRAGELPARPTPTAVLPRASVPSPEAWAEPDQPQQPHSQNLDRNGYGISLRRFRQPLPDAAQEALAQHVYSTLNSRSGDTNHHISQANARRCVEAYGAQAVQKALALLLSRRNVLQPVAFFLTILRSVKTP